MLSKRNNGKVEAPAQLLRTLKWTRNKIEWEPENKEEIIKLKLKIASKEKDYTKTLKRPDKENFIVTTEIANFAHKHCSDKLQRPELYKLNKISFEEKFKNLLLLLSDDCEQSMTIIANLLNN